jgi:hypothetical protein
MTHCILCGAILAIIGLVLWGLGKLLEDRWRPWL